MGIIEPVRLSFGGQMFHSSGGPFLRRDARAYRSVS